MLDEHAAARRWTLPLDRLDPSIDRLVIWDAGWLDEDEEAALEDWVAAGHIALLGGHFALSDSDYAVRYDSGSEVAWPTAAHSATLGVQKVVVGEGRFGADAAERLVHLKDGHGNPVLISWPLGQGRIFWSADTEWLTNKRIAQAGNLDLALQLLIPAPGKVVAFDEFHHGYRSATQWWQILRGPLQLFLVLLSGAITLLFWAYGARFGSPRPSPTTPPRAAVEYVYSMGLLYRRAQARGMVLQVLYRTLTTELGRLLGGARGLTHIEMAQRAAQHLALPADQIERLLNQAAPYSNAKPTEPELIQLAREAEVLQRRMQNAGYQDQRDPSTGTD